MRTLKIVHWGTGGEETLTTTESLYRDWNLEDYNNITTLCVPSDTFWSPDISKTLRFFSVNPNPIYYTPPNHKIPVIKNAGSVVINIMPQN